MDHTPKGRNRVYKGVRLLAAVGMAVALAAVGYQYLGGIRGELPEVSNGPYLTLNELGVEGERKPYFSNESSKLRYEKGLLSENWYTNEQVYQPLQEDMVWLYQDIYRLRCPELAGPFVQSLMWDSIWNDSPSDYICQPDSRFDGLWTGRNELFVWSGNTVWVFTYFEEETAFSQEDLLKAVAGRQSK